MRALFTQISGLAGLLAFLNQLWNYAPLERTILLGFGTGVVVYLMLVVGDLAITRILEYSPPRLAEEAAGGAPEGAANAAQAEGEPAQTRAAA